MDGVDGLLEVLQRVADGRLVDDHVAPADERPRRHDVELVELEAARPRRGAAEFRRGRPCRCR